MTNITILSDDTNNYSLNNKEAVPAPERTITFQLTGQPGEAIFKVPTIGGAIAAQKTNPNSSPSELYRSLATDNLISWGGEASMPMDSEIDIVDDLTILELFSFDTSSGTFEVLPDKSHEVATTAGNLVLRRPTRQDVRKVESLNKSVQSGKISPVMSDLMWACDLTIKWWRDNRSIMPGDFNELPLSDYSNIGAALQAFFPRRTALNRS
jgi:hypothetical protein